MRLLNKKINNLKTSKMHIFAVVVITTVFCALQADAASKKSLDYGSEYSFVDIHGIISQEYSDFQKDGVNNGNNTYNNSVAFLFFNCNVSRKLKGVLEFRANHGAGDLMIDRCFIDYKIKKTLGIKVGKIYLETYLGTKIHRPTMNKLVSEIFPVGGFYDTVLFRNVGVAVYGERYMNERLKIGYHVTVTNGSMIEKAEVDEQMNLYFKETTRDINKHKAISCVLNVWPHKNLKVSGGMYNALANIQTFITILYPTVTPGMDTLVTTRKVMGDSDYKTRSYSVEWSKNNLGIYFAGFSTQFINKSGLKVVVVGNYIGELTCRIIEDKSVHYVDLVFRLSSYSVDLRGDYSIQFPDAKNTIYIPGINISPVKHFNLKAEYQIIKERGGAALDNNGVMFQAVLDF